MSFWDFGRWVKKGKKRKQPWPRTESNCRHEDFQSSALPTELQGLGYDQNMKGAANVNEPLVFYVKQFVST